MTTIWKPVGMSPQAAPVQPQPPGETVSDSGLRALNAADGLFLRAEHLRQMQTYAEQFALLSWTLSISKTTNGRVRW